MRWGISIDSFTSVHNHLKGACTNGVTESNMMSIKLSSRVYLAGEVVKYCSLCTPLLLASMGSASPVLSYASILSA